MVVSPLYVVIDLGSNSFHMLVTRLLANSVQTVDKIKRKVRLASGLDENNVLSEEAMARGLDCLSFFAERLDGIPAGNVRIVATATLRIAVNAQDFIHQAEKILKRKIILLSGEEEANTIYLGVAHTSNSEGKRLVLDIGGASTELVVGEEFQAKRFKSLNLGCVTFNQTFFADGALTRHNFQLAIAEAKKILAPEISAYKALGWESVLGGSGTMQALAEILMHRQQPAIITYEFLLECQQKLMACGKTDAIKIAGLLNERKPVFASGLAILIALFESLEIDDLQLSSGALREGLLYEMLPDMRCQMIRLRTIHSLAERFHLDQQRSLRIASLIDVLFDLLASNWQLSRDNSYQLLMAACALRQIGLLLSYKSHQQHGAYILQQADLPGFDQADRQLVVALVKSYKGEIDMDSLQHQSATSVEHSLYLLIILRLAVILSQRRQDDVFPIISIAETNNIIRLNIPSAWLLKHPLIHDELLQESALLRCVGYQLDII